MAPFLLGLIGLSLVSFAAADDAMCSAGSECSTTGPAMVQLNRRNTKLKTSGEKVIEALVFYTNEAGRKATLNADVGGTAHGLSSLHSTVLLLSETEYQKLMANTNVLVSESSEGDYSTSVHSMGEAFTQRNGEEDTPYGVEMVNPSSPDDPLQQGDTEIKVCVVDTGYDRGHEDLPDATDGVNGTNPYDSGDWYVDGHSHGTHCAGTIGAIGGNGKGVTSPNPNPSKFKFHIGKGLQDSGSGSTANVMVAVGACVDAGAKVISMSLGGGSPSEGIAAEYKLAYEKGILIIAAAGNSGNSNLGYPASYPHVMSVAAVNAQKIKAGFSQFNDQVEISGPGVEVKSTVPDNKYAEYSGTSMACPHVAAVAALVWSHFPECTNTQIRHVLTKSAEDLGDEGCDVNYGWGLVNAKAAYDLLSEGGCEAGDIESIGDEVFGGCQQGVQSPTPAPTPFPACDGTCASRRFQIEVTTDKYAGETAWTLVDENGLQITSGGSYTTANTEYYDQYACLGSGSYTFAITDSYGDGICCDYGEGGYVIRVAGVEVATGGDFGNGETKIIEACGENGTPSPPEGVPPTPSPTPAPTSPPLADPTPSPTPTDSGPPEGPRGPPGPPGMDGPPGPPGEPR